MSGLSLTDPSARPSCWRSCLAARDWNFVEKDSDRFPFKVPSGDVKRCHQLFNDIKSLCMMTDSTGPSGSYKAHTFVQTTQGGQILSCLDRIYFPQDGWSATPPVPIRTNHSDHFFVWSDCFITAPKVELAVPAPRLPSLKLLDRGPFWPLVLSAWTGLTSGVISLPSWTVFKQSVLASGLSVSKSRKKSLVNNWKSTLRGDGVTCDELADITFDWQASPSPAPVCGHFVADGWPSAIPAYDSRLLPSGCPRKVVLYPDALTGSCTIRPVMGTTPRVDPAPSAPLRSVADLLDARIAVKRASQLKKYKEMDRF